MEYGLMSTEDLLAMWFYYANEAAKEMPLEEVDRILSEIEKEMATR